MNANQRLTLGGIGCPVDGLGIIAPTITLPPAPAKPTLVESISNFFTKAESVVKTATPVAQQGKSLFDLFKSTKSNLLNPTTPGAPPPPASEEGMSTAAKIGIAAVAALAITAIGINIHRSGKKRKALGEVTEDVPAEVVASVLNGTKKRRKKKVNRKK